MVSSYRQTQARPAPSTKKGSTFLGRHTSWRSVLGISFPLPPPAKLRCQFFTSLATNFLRFIFLNFKLSKKQRKAQTSVRKKPKQKGWWWEAKHLFPGVAKITESVLARIDSSRYGISSLLLHYFAASQ
jgi:hypothetical protein